MQDVSINTHFMPPVIVVEERVEMWCMRQRLRDFKS